MGGRFWVFWVFWVCDATHCGLRVYAIAYGAVQRYHVPYIPRWRSGSAADC